MAELFLAWLRIGLFGFGGGPSVLPLVRAECVERNHWLTDEEFLDGIAFGNALPGPISVKLAAYVGKHVAGWEGCAVALLALCAPSVAMMLGLGAAYFRWRDTPGVVGALRGVRPAIVAMLAWTVFTLAPDGVRDWRSGLLAAGAFLALVAEVHPAVVVAVSVGIGVFFLRG